MCDACRSYWSVCLQCTQPAWPSPSIDDQPPFIASSSAADGQNASDLIALIHRFLISSFPPEIEFENLSSNLKRWIIAHASMDHRSCIDVSSLMHPCIIAHSSRCYRFMQRCHRNVIAMTSMSSLVIPHVAELKAGRSSDFHELSVGYL